MTMLPLVARAAGVLSNSVRTQGRNVNKKIFKLGTFNVRGLTKDVKQNQLSKDMTRYGLDVACIQETKVTLLVNKEVGENRLICNESVSGHYGLGFMVAPRWKDHIHRFWRVNDRISVLQLQTNESKRRKMEGEKYSSQLIGMKLIISKQEPIDHMINIINVYAPTSDKVAKDKREVEEMYSEIEKLLKKFKKMKSSVTMVAGDFNAKVGRKLNEEKCLGNYSNGKRNQSGQLLTEFCERNELFISNTSFQHPTKHRTTWSQQRIEKNSNTVKNVYNQIDYVLVEGNKKQCLIDARSYAGTETFSDHRLVITKIQADWTELYRKINKRKQEQTKKVNTRRLITEEDTRKKYSTALDERIEYLDTWEELSEACQKTAEEVLGFVEKEKPREVKDEKISKMSSEQRDIKMKMMKEKDPETLQQLKEGRKKIQKAIKKEIKLIREKEIDTIVSEIESTKDDARMFKATKKLERKPFENPVVHDKEGKNVTEPQQMYSIVKDHFQKQFYKEDQPDVERFVGTPKPLNRPISATEVAKATAGMANGKASNGPAAELVKYASIQMHQKIA